MRNRLLIDVLWIIVVFGLFAAVVYLTPQPVLLLESMAVAPPTNEVTGEPGSLYDDPETGEPGYYTQFELQAEMVLAISLLGVLAWYVVGQWGPKPHATKPATWTLIWLLDFLFVIGGAIAVFFSYPMPAANDQFVVIIFAVIAALSFYIATVLFSPVNIKFVVPGSKIFRRW
jgi:hypothetical protein